MLRFILFFLTTCLIACATPTSQRPIVTLPELQTEITFQAREQFREYMDRDYRVKLIKDRLLYASRGMCKDVRFEYGFLYFDPIKLKTEHPVQNALFLDYMGLDKEERYPVVTYIRQGSSAWKGGLKKRDRILTWQGESTRAKLKRIHVKDPTTNKIVRTKLKWVRTFEKILKESPDNERVSLKVRRRIGSTHDSVQPIYKDTTFTLEMTKRLMCDNPAFYVEGTQVNAYTDGKNIGVTTGMLNSVSDDELALVIAHELAHCFEKHISKKKRNAFLGSLAGAFVDGLGTGLGIPTYGQYQRKGALAGAMSFSQEFELEADYIGLYIMARAGYPTDHAADFWRKMAERGPLDSNSLTGSHPPTSERYILLSKTHLEIKKKIVDGKKLFPNQTITEH